jgi:hypothetical protein
MQDRLDWASKPRLGAIGSGMCAIWGAWSTEVASNGSRYLMRLPCSLGRGGLGCHFRVGVNLENSGGRGMACHDRIGLVVKIHSDRDTAIIARPEAWQNLDSVAADGMKLDKAVCLGFG